LQRNFSSAGQDISLHHLVPGEKSSGFDIGMNQLQHVSHEEIEPIIKKMELLEHHFMVSDTFRLRGGGHDNESDRTMTSLLQQHVSSGSQHSFGWINANNLQGTSRLSTSPNKQTVRSSSPSFRAAQIGADLHIKRVQENLSSHSQDRPQSISGFPNSTASRVVEMGNNFPPLTPWANDNGISRHMSEMQTIGTAPNAGRFVGEPCHDHYVEPALPPASNVKAKSNNHNYFFTTNSNVIGGGDQHQSTSLGSISATNMSAATGSMGSINQTLITAHVQTRAGHSNSALQAQAQKQKGVHSNLAKASKSTNFARGQGVTVAESPPTMNLCAQTMSEPQPQAQQGQSGVVRSLANAVHGSHYDNVTSNKTESKRKSTKPIKNASSKKRPPPSTHENPPTKRKGRRSYSNEECEKHETHNVDFLSDNVNNANSYIDSKSIQINFDTKLENKAVANVPLGNISQRIASPLLDGANSRSYSNPFTSASRTPNKIVKPPPKNMRITSFFGTATTSSTQRISNTSLSTPVVSLDSNANITTSAHQTTLNNTSTPYLQKVITSQQQKITTLQATLEDKQAQLKAVANNQTMLHATLKSALQSREKEIEEMKTQARTRQSLTSEVIESMIREQATTEAMELRQKLASDGAQLGRLVYNRVGMHTVENWEEGEASRSHKRQRNDLKRRRDTLDGKKNTLENCDESTNEQIEMESARESVMMHLEELEKKEIKLAKEEQALYVEKGVHIRALKRVSSEDTSRFNSRPKLHDRYVLLSQLGRGGFSEVWSAYDLIELRKVAVKIHQLDPRWSEAKIENYTKHVAREYEIHRDVRHPRIVSLYDVFEIDNNSFATVLECCNGTDLDTLLKERKTLPERHARAILLQILSGMKYLSTPSSDNTRQGIIHYDLKPGNILFDENGDAKITDFGLSKIMDSADPSDSMELTSQGAGTYWYLPPECFVTHQSVKISNKVDVWSIGVILYQMLFGKRPFGDGQSQDKVLSNNIMLNAREVRFPSEPKVSSECKELIRQCLTYDHPLRPTIAQLSEHCYVRQKGCV